MIGAGESAQRILVSCYNLKAAQAQQQLDLPAQQAIISQQKQAISANQPIYDAYSAAWASVQNNMTQVTSSAAATPVDNAAMTQTGANRDILSGQVDSYVNQSQPGTSLPYQRRNPPR